MQSFPIWLERELKLSEQCFVSYSHVTLKSESKLIFSKYFQIRNTREYYLLV